MLRDRILFTLKFFDLQQTPLTLIQLRDFLFNEPDALKQSVNENFEIQKDVNIPTEVNTDEILEILNSDLKSEVAMMNGYYCLVGRTEIIEQRLENDIYRIHREKIISRFLPGLRFIPFVRGVGVGGSQTLGSSKSTSDIDLLIILDPRFLFLGRMLVTGYFQLTGHRRHGQKIQNRFCLNHYLGGPIVVSDERDPYNAMEYLRLRGEIYSQPIAEFIQKNLFWMKKFFPNAKVEPWPEHKRSGLQSFLEKIFTNPLGVWLDQKLGNWQLKRIKRGEHAVASEIELSFHSKQRKFDFLGKIFDKPRT